ncbi:nucleotidyl transferase AbiEii/AbiGii toxin family protein [Dyadobacter sp. BHUBP1]|uniref:nucleotidyl transferase AbiEii/AbiGii toxin family protein n=1 Tax=Dyadobacter sp. BHUBP1 TaxID=3424178 RepID=UPI003D355AE8
MSRSEFYGLKANDKKVIFEAISSETGMPAFAVEKDWWVTETLAIIFEMEVASQLVFKGGTSLSKAWRLIYRFSEDIDLAIDRKFFGFEGELSKKQMTALRKKAGEYTIGPFFEELQRKFAERGFEVKFNVVEYKDSDQDPRIIEIYYPNVVEAPGYVEPRVQVEIGCRSLREPFKDCTFGSLVDEQYGGREFASPLITVPTVYAERTFLEKLFLLHEEFNRPEEKIRVDRLSRHLYDVHYLSKSEAAIALTDQDLYETIVSHRYVFSKMGGVDYNLHNPKTLNPHPPDSVVHAWAADYSRMREEMIYEENPPTFDELLASIDKMKARLAEVPWEYRLAFAEKK